MMQSCTVTLSFSAAKRLPDFDGNCKHVHGYGHKIEVTFAPKGSDGDLVVDFYKVKNVLGQWIDGHWDHTILLHEKDKSLGNLIAQHTGQTPFYFDTSPTAENLAKFLCTQICPELLPQVICIKVRVYDNPEVWAEFSV